MYSGLIFRKKARQPNYKRQIYASASYNETD